MTCERSVFFSSDTPVSSTNKTDRHDIIDILLKVALNTITITPLITIFFYREALPGNWNEDFDSFQKMIILKCLRPDKVTDAMQDYVSENLGQRFIEPQTADLDLVFKDSSPTIPLIFVLSAGTDPAADLYKFADKLRFSKKLNASSLGQGQVCTFLIKNCVIIEGKNEGF